nr:auxilin-like protein [Tanacetum cinerariifolium]
MVKDMEAHFDMIVREKVVFECLRAPRAQDFLPTISIDGLGQQMSPVEYRTILKYRFMIILFSVDAICLVCRKACLDSFAEHAVHCKELLGFKYRHDMLLLHAWYLDDGTLIGDSKEVTRVLDIIKVSDPGLGLQLNITKTKIFWPSCNSEKLREGLFRVNIRRPSLAVKLLGGAVVVKDGLSPFVTDELVVKEKKSSLVDTSIPNVENTDLKSYPPLPTQGSTPSSNTPGMSLYANVIGKPSGTKVNFLTLFTLGGNGIDLVVPIEYIRAISERSSYARAMIEIRANVELKDNIVVDMPKITKEWNYTCNIRVEYEWKPPRCTSCKVFGHTHEDCPKNIGVGVTMNLKKTSQAPKGIPVGTKMGFEQNKEYRHVSKKHTGNSSGNKKRGVNFTNKVEYTRDHDSKDEVASDDNSIDHSLASKKTGFGTQILVEQWKDSYGNGYYDEDPYDDHMNEGHDLSEEIQTICDKLEREFEGARSDKLDTRVCVPFFKDVVLPM